jgi:hypothetical protein
MRVRELTRTLDAASLDDDAIALPRANLRLSKAGLRRLGYVKDGDVAFVAGTLVQGLGNPYSDVDLYVITDKLRCASDIELKRHHRALSAQRDILRSSSSEEVYILHSAIPDSYVKVDVEYLTYAQLEALRERVEQLFEYAAHNLVLLTKTLTVREQALIHRTTHGIPITDARLAAPVLQTFDVDAYTYIAYRWLASDFSILLDMAGAARMSEWDRAADIARENVVRQVTAMMHLNGLTDTVQRKWVLKYAADRRFLPPDLHDRFRKFFYFEGVAADGFEGYVRDSLDFVDEIFSRSAKLLDEHPRAPSGELALRLLEKDHQFADHDTPLAAWEYEYRRKAYGLRGRPSREYLDLDSVQGERRTPA